MAVGLDLHTQHHTAFTAMRDMSTASLRECADDRRRVHLPCRRHEGNRQRPPRGGIAALTSFRNGSDYVDFRAAAAGPIEHTNSIESCGTKKRGAEGSTEMREAGKPAN